MTIRVPLGDSEFEQRCASLRHTWLERRLLPRLREAHLSKETLGAEPPGFLMAVPVKVSEVREVLQLAQDACSPARLVAIEPLRDLPKDVRTWLCEILHEQYLEAGGVQAEIGEAEAAATDLDRAIRQILDGWTHEPRHQAGMWNAAEEAATRLRDALGKLGSGAVLP